ncbi:MAG: hypothetical protein RLY16_2218 [Bacteroidota bacterium]
MKKNRLILFIAFSFTMLLCASAFGQNAFFRKQEDSLKVLAKEIVEGKSSIVRFTADSVFTKVLVRSLKQPYSFSYPFDSLLPISRLYAPDSSFRIFTWQMVINDNLTRQHGAIQMRTSDGSLKLFPLIDKSDVTTQLLDTSGNNRGWIGAVYYRLIQTKSSGQNFYTLLGFDENNLRSTRKLIEVLSFKNDEPYFGGRLISFEEDSVFKSANSRYIMEFRKDAGARLAYDEDLQMIIAEHLTSESGEPQKKWTYVPDGDYEGFRWKNGKWIHVEKVFNQVTPEGMEPVPHPLPVTNGDPEIDKLTPTPKPPKKNGGQE